MDRSDRRAASGRYDPLFFARKEKIVFGPDRTKQIERRLNMEKPDFKKIAVREAAVITFCIAAAFGIGRFGAFMPGIGKEFFSINLAAMLYLASIALRVVGTFIRMTLKVALMVELVAIVFLFLAIRYPAVFSFLK